MFFLKRHLFLLGFFLFAFLTTPVYTVAQNNSSFTINQVVINACLGYIEVSVQYSPGDVISYQWFEKDASGNFVSMTNETSRILRASPGDYKIEITNATINQVISGEYQLSGAFPLAATDLFSGLICSERTDSGAILVRLDNGSSPYQYTLTDSNGVAVDQGNTAQGQDTELVENLNVGTYTLSWQDSFGCTGTLSIAIDIPTQLTASSSTNSPLCFGGTGGLTFSVNGEFYESGSI